MHRLTGWGDIPSDIVEMPSSKRSRSEDAVLSAPTPFHAVLGFNAARAAASAAGSLAAAAATAATMRRLVEAVKQAGSEPKRVRAALFALRTALSVQWRPPIREAMDAGVLDVLNGHILSTSASVQAEAAWVLTNLCSGPSVEVHRVLDADLAESVRRALLTKVGGPLTTSAAQSELCNQLLWALGNMAADEDVSIRNRLLGDFDVVQTLGSVFEQMPELHWDPVERTQVLRTMTWTASSLCRGTPPPPLEEVGCFFDYFVQVVCGTDDEQMLADAIWGLYYLVEEVAKDASGLLSAGLAQGEEAPSPHPAIAKVVECAGRPGDVRSPLTVPALKLLESLVSGEGDAGSAAAGAAIAAKALPALAKAVQDKDAPDEVRHLAAWALANVARGTAQQSRQLVEDPAVWGALRGALAFARGPAALDRGVPPEARRWCMLAAAEALGQLGEEALARVEFWEASGLLKQWAHATQVGAVAGALALAEEPGVPSSAPADAALQVALLSAAEALMRHPKVRQPDGENLFEHRIMHGRGDDDEGWADSLQESSDATVRKKANDLMAKWYSLINGTQVQMSPASRRGSENAGVQQRAAADYESPKRAPRVNNDENVQASPNVGRLDFDMTPQHSPGSKPPSLAGTPLLARTAAKAPLGGS